MKKIFIFLVAISFISSQKIYSQTTITLQPGPEGKDAQLWSITPDENHGDIPKFSCMGWTHNGVPGVNRGLIDFDLSSIPAGAQITSAKLNLYFVCLEPTYFGHTGENESFLQLITEPWEEESVTWNNQPSTAEEDQVYLPQSTDPYQDYTDIDVTLLMQRIFNEPDNYHGMMLRLLNENPYRCLLFASSDYSDTIEMRPKLEVTYTINPTNTIVIQPGPEEGKDAQLWTIMPDNNYGDIPKFDCSGWTHYGVPGVNRGIIDFDLSAIPEGAYITEAKLNFYFVCLEPTYFGHTGENDAYLQLITEPWDEHTVTWNNQPATTETDQVYLPPSTDPYMDYTDIDVTSLIQNLYSDPGSYHGIMLRLLNENPYRCLLFASSDYSDTVEMRPKLEITYSFCQQPVADFSYEIDDFSVYFSDNSEYGESVWWDFGDGYYSDLNDPWHIYDFPGIYEVCLKTCNSCGMDSVCEIITIGSMTDVRDNEPVLYHTYPNPARDYITITSETEGRADISLLNPNGQILINKSFELKNEETARLDLGGILEGLYYLRITGGNSTSVKKIIIDR